MSLDKQRINAVTKLRELGYKWNDNGMTWDSKGPGPSISAMLRDTLSAINPVLEAFDEAYEEDDDVPTQLVKNMTKLRAAQQEITKYLINSDPETNVAVATFGKRGVAVSVRPAAVPQGNRVSGSYPSKQKRKP